MMGDTPAMDAELIALAKHAARYGDHAGRSAALISQSNVVTYLGNMPHPLQVSELAPRLFRALQSGVR
jgi:hypothetical protein